MSGLEIEGVDYNKEDLKVNEKKLLTKIINEDHDFDGGLAFLVEGIKDDVEQKVSVKKKQTYGTKGTPLD